MKEQLSQITPVQAVVCSAIVVGLYWMLVYDDGKQKRSELKAAESSFETKSKELADTTKKIKDAQRYKKLNEKLSDLLKSIASAVPEVRESSVDKHNEKRELERMLSKQVSDVGAELKSVSAGSWVAADKKGKNKDVDTLGGKFESIDLSLNIECSFRHVMVLLSNLTKTGRIFTIDNLTVAPQGDGSQLKKNQSLLVSFTVKLKTYRYLIKKEKTEAS